MPKPPPDTIFPASHPAMSPTSNMMSKLSADKYILVTRQLGDYELSTALGLTTRRNEWVSLDPGPAVLVKACFQASESRRAPV